jgi:DNA invertase Pin-like site-specific DNA recombinase
MVTVLAGLAEFERALIMARTGEGRTRAMARGVRFDRKPKLTPHQTHEALARDGGKSDGHCPKLQRQPLDNFEALRGDKP